MRRLLVAGLAAVAVVLGLVVTAGAASAAPAAWTPPSCTPVAPATSCTPTFPSHTPHPGGFPGHGHGLPGGDLGGNWHPGLPWSGASLYGHQLWVSAQLGLDVCGYSNYDTFLSRNMRYRSDIDRLLDRNRWQSLYSSDCTNSLAVLPGGLSLVNGNLLNLSLLGLSDGGTVNVCDYPDWNVFDNRFGSRFGGRWGGVRSHFGGNAFGEFRELRRQARCTVAVMPSSTTIVTEPTTTVTASAPSPALSDPSDVAPAASAPVTKTPSALAAPDVAPANGGASVAYVLAHARVA